MTYIKLLCAAYLLGVSGGCQVASMSFVPAEESALDANIDVDFSDKDQPSDTNGDDSKGDNTPPPAKTCKNSTPITMTAPLAFTEQKSCSFGIGDNLSPVNSRLRAIESQTKVLNLPDHAEICSFELKSTHQQLHYDDYFFLTVNDRVLISSEVRWTDFLEDVGEFKKFDFLKLRDQPHSHVEQSVDYGTPYCFSDADCQIPDHDKVGPLYFSIASSMMGSIKNMSKSSDGLRFSVYATGDDDYGDCDFSSFDLELTVSYVPANGSDD